MSLLLIRQVIAKSRPPVPARPLSGRGTGGYKIVRRVLVVVVVDLSIQQQNVPLRRLRQPDEHYYPGDCEDGTEPGAQGRPFASALPEDQGPYGSERTERRDEE